MLFVRTGWVGLGWVGLVRVALGCVVLSWVCVRMIARFCFSLRVRLFFCTLFVSGCLCVVLTSCSYVCLSVYVVSFARCSFVRVFICFFICLSKCVFFLLASCVCESYGFFVCLLFAR